MLLRKILPVMILIAALSIAFACSKKQTIKHEAEEQVAPETKVPEEIPAVEEEPVTREPEPAPVMPELEDAFFDFDKYNLRGDAKRSLERDAEELKKASDTYVVIEGHCDERGTEDYNLALGEKRAKSAMNYLVSLGVSPGRISVISYGESRPFDTGHNEEAWSKNRRAHFVIKK